MSGVKELLAKYKASRRPALDELVNGELLKIFQRGVIEERLTPFGILLPLRGEPEGSPNRWYGGHFININPRWEVHCTALREWKDKKGRKLFDKRCESWDMKHAHIAAEKKQPIIYLCYAGLVDYALPIVVDGQTIAVLLTGQQYPAGGAIWSAAFVNNVATEDNIAGSEDAEAECVKRNESVIAEMRLADPTKALPKLVALARDAPKISPGRVADILKEMREASEQLSGLAERTVGYELNVIRAYFVSRATQLLAVPDEDFWPDFSRFITELAEFYGMDYAFLYMLRREHDEYMDACTGVPESFPGVKPPLIRSSRFFPTLETVNCRAILYEPEQAEEALFKSKRLFDSPCHVIPMTVNGPLGIIIMGHFGRRKTPRFAATSIDLLQKQCEVISIILENRRQMQSRDIYVTDIAHEIRSPLAAVLATAENLVAGILDQVEYRSARILKRLRRLQMAIERFMMLDRLVSTPETLEPMFVAIDDIAKECKSVYADLGKENKVGITLNKTLSTLPKARADREAFKHALGNLIHNAVKYGDPFTEVIVEGRDTGIQTKIDVRNIGIPIPEEAKPLLGQRHFRTVEAIKREPSGTGIGLTLVSHFLKLIGGRLEIKSEQLSSGRYHTIFSMYLPK